MKYNFDINCDLFIAYHGTDGVEGSAELATKLYDDLMSDPVIASLNIFNFIKCCKKKYRAI